MGRNSLSKVQLLGLVLAATAITSCGPRLSGDKVVTIKGITYYFPGRELDAFSTPEKSGHGHHYVRLMPPPGYLMLVYSPSTTSRENQNGPNVPTIDWINDVPGENVEVIHTKSGPVVCRITNSDLHYTCGLRVIDKGLVWSVKFDRDLVKSADALRSRAEATLQGYRTDYRLKRS